jgi:4-hydroxy-tetrahydrodipicolinate synthase
MFLRRAVRTLVILLAVLTARPLASAQAGPPIAAAPDCCTWAGIYPTVLTPFCDGGVDTAALEREIRYQLHGGVHGLLLLGTFGEGQYVTLEERAQVVATAVRVAGPHVPVIVGIHTCNWDEAALQLRQAKELGAAAVLVKYLGNPKASADEVLGFYAALADLHVLPILYYHFPGQTGLALTPEQIAAIVSLPGVVGIKESTLNLREMEAHIRLTHGLGKAVFTSTALSLTQFLALGGQGAMCPEAALLPGPTVQAYAAFVQGRHDEARAVQKDLFVLLPILRTRPTLPAVEAPLQMAAEDHKVPLPLGDDHPQAQLKAALACLGVPMSAMVKCPLPPLTEREKQRVQAAVTRAQRTDWEAAAYQAPAPPRDTDTEASRGGFLLQTGAIQLGPGVGRNLWRWQWDGEGGF